ncbi:MAG: hypothetical protein GY861_06845 [bacterium]|nr:hypothetical protein [bacterium]
MKLLVILVILAVFFVGCAQEEPPVKATPDTLKGVSLSPRSFEGTDFTDFFEEAKQTGNTVMWAGDWMELGKEESAPKTVTGLADVYDYVPLIEGTFHDNGNLLRPLNDATKKLYKDSAVAFAEKNKPAYLALGIEVNNVYIENPEDFEKFVLLYNEIYDAVKVVSPETKVFTVFQLERMKGLKLWDIEETEAHWELIDRFKTDLIVFTTYPGIFYMDPSDIPNDHYTEITKHTTKPIGFTEIGWHSEASPQGWESSDAEQAEFIEKFFTLTKDLNVKITIWSFMYDLDGMEPFRSMGLRRSDGSAKPAWDAWLKE